MTEETMQKKILVTGATGFIGHHVVQWRWITVTT